MLASVLQCRLWSTLGYGSTLGLLCVSTSSSLLARCCSFHRFGMLVSSASILPFCILVSQLSVFGLHCMPAVLPCCFFSESSNTSWLILFINDHSIY